MEMQKHMSLRVLFYTIGFLACLKFGFGSIFEGYSKKSCIDGEKQALLLLKKSLIDGSDYLSSWIGDDCCAWHGVGCNNISSHVMQLDLRYGGLKGGEILPSLLDLKYLTYLDLSYNDFFIQIPEFFGSFKNLEYLNLSYSFFTGLVPHHLGNLSSLRYLDLSIGFLSFDSMGWLSKISSLEHLDLSYVDLSNQVDWFLAINKLPSSISVLKLNSCQLPSNFPTNYLKNLTSLISLDLGKNFFNTSFPLWVFNNGGLAHLTLGDNHFSGRIPNLIGRLTSLLELDLSSNNFYGSIPKSIRSLTDLVSLDLSCNELEGLIPESIWALTALTNLNLFQNILQGSIPRTIGNMTSLSTLNLSNNKINQSIPPEMGNLTELTYLSISSNELRGSLPISFCQLSKLEVLYARDNQLSGSIPKCIGKLSNFKYLDLFSNSWEGVVSEHHFFNLTRLTSLSISSNSNLVLNVSSKWVPPFQLEDINLESLKVGPKFPRWLLTQRHIGGIRMRNTSISDTIPADWFVSLPEDTAVNLSNNDINVEQLSLIPATPNGLRALSLSYNRLSGEFPAFLCNITSLGTIVISNNNLSGEIPLCISYLTNLIYFDVMNNNFSGNIPPSLGSLGYLRYLNLHNNKFRGQLPLSFQNLKGLVTLDVGKNNLNDILPPWIGEQLPYLRYLILRSNNFYGNIPTEICHLSSIQVLNLARNQITGNIPSCFGNFSAMIKSDTSDPFYPGFSITNGQMIIDDVKGYELKYTSTLGFLFSIDLSNNNISGEIPEELMDLYGLLNLNLAGNHLAGRIPDRIGKLEKLEFLDLSRNELYGPIPRTLSDLHFLSHLNLSFNNLSGRIPTGNQLQTLDDPSTYVGNNLLCGWPIPKPCVGDTESLNVEDYNEADSDLDDERTWFYAGIGPGLLVGFLGFCASLHFINSWRYSYFHFVEQVFDKIAVANALLQRKFYN